MSVRLETISKPRRRDQHHNPGFRVQYCHTLQKRTLGMHKPNGPNIYQMFVKIMLMITAKGEV